MKRGENLRKHGLTGIPEHRSWCSMITRCYSNNPSRRDFHLYQGAGIKVCDRWRSDFWNFLADMGRKPTTRHSIERRNSTKDYEPSNCVWASPREQARNTSRNRRITVSGVTRTLVEWSQLTGVKRETISDRLASGWGADRSVNTPTLRQRTRTAKGRFEAL